MEYRYFNNAGAGLMSKGTFDCITNHMKLEMKVGAYKAAAMENEAVKTFYTRAAKLINAASDEEIAFIDSASRGWNLAVYGLDIEASDMIITLSSEYGTNLLTLYDIAEKKHCSITMIECDTEGKFNINDVEDAMRAGATILAVSHVAAQGSIINPVEELGKLAQKYGVKYIVDGCQAVGQIAVDVQKINCCAYVTAGRKWLRGPRGTGILYVRKDAPIHTPQIDLASADLVFDKQRNITGLTVREDAKQFELWEKSTASLLGLSNAIQEYMNYGCERASNGISAKADYIRKTVASNPNLVLVGSEASCTGVVGFYTKNPGMEEILKGSMEGSGFIISYVCDWDCPVFFPQNGNRYIFRVSPHYYTSDEDIQAISKLLEEF